MEQEYPLRKTDAFLKATNSPQGRKTWAANLLQNVKQRRTDMNSDLRAQLEANAEILTNNPPDQDTLLEWSGMVINAASDDIAKTFLAYAASMDDAAGHKKVEPSQQPGQNKP